MAIPVSVHLDLYRYWETKRCDRLPTRADIDPTDIPRLLPSLALVERQPGGYYWRLMGGRIVRDLGCDLTGKTFGDYVGSPWFVRAMLASFDRSLDGGEPLFEESLYDSGSRGTHWVSRLLLPLGATARTPQMILLTRITRRMPEEPEPHFLRGSRGHIVASAPVFSADELAQRAAHWESTAQPPSPTKIIQKPVIRVGNLWGPGLPYSIRAGARRAMVA